MMKTEQITVKSTAHSDLISLTGDVRNAVQRLGISDGLINLFVLHTTCGLTINENADPDVVHDLLHRLDKLAPWNAPKDKHAEGNSAAHMKSTILGVSLTIPVKNGKLILGTWQGIYLGEFDGPRTRTVYVTALSDS